MREELFSLSTARILVTGQWLAVKFHKGLSKSYSSDISLEFVVNIGYTNTKSWPYFFIKYELAFSFWSNSVVSAVVL